MFRVGVWLLAWLVASVPTSADAQRARTGKPDRIRTVLEQPANPAHGDIYEMIKDRGSLEKLKEFLGPLRLPRPLLLKVAGCDGTANAWYVPSDRTVTVCYEYIDDVRRHAPKETTPEGVTPQDAVVGPFIEVFLHEVAHALFDMLKIPVLGREEDAADQVAAYILLQLGKDEARRTIGGIAYMYFREAREQSTALTAFAAVHGLPAQRFYNILCLTYGSDPKLFADIVDKGYLPPRRAEGCEDEYKQVQHAFRTLIRPHVDRARARRVLAKKWLRPPEQTDAGR